MGCSPFSPSFVLIHPIDTGSLHASVVLYERLLESVLFTSIRWHDTVNRGRVLNRFGKDFEGIDSNLSDNFGRSVMYGMSSITTLVTICVVGGWQFIIPAIALGGLYYNSTLPTCAQMVAD